MPSRPCPACNQTVSFSFDAIHNDVSCPTCQAVFCPLSGAIRQPPGTETTPCPGCGRAITWTPDELPLDVICAKCDTRFEISVPSNRFQSEPEPEEAIDPGPLSGRPYPKALIAGVFFLAAITLLAVVISVASSARDRAASSSPSPRFTSDDEKEAWRTGLFVLAILLYPIPIVIAAMRRHPNTAPICIITIFLGWTFIGWVIGLIWSLTAIDVSRQYR